MSEPVPQINTAARDWKIVEEWATKQLTDYGKRNESNALDEVATAHLRGRIAQLRALLALAVPKQVTDDQSSGHDVVS